MNIIEFKDIEKEDKPIFDKAFKSQYYENAEYTFTNLYMWRVLFNIQFAFEDDVLYISSSNKSTLGAWQPIGTPEKMQESITKLLEWGEAHKGNKEFKFVTLEKKFVEELEKYPHAKFNIEADRDSFNYVYLADDLINLSGRKFHSKKNHLNAFRKDYPNAEYLPITEDIIPQCHEELNRWYEIHRKEFPNDPLLCYEQAAIHEIFDNFTDFKVKGGAIKLNDKIIAFTFGEQLNDDTAVIHVEKADPDIRGAYPAINQGFVAHEWSNMKYINREEDMGLEGLRKAKESYKPIKMIEKFNATIVH